jgi:hypothetical protein
LQDKPEIRAKVLSAFSKLLWIQNDLFAKFYVMEGQDLLHGSAAAQFNNTSIVAKLSNSNFVQGTLVGSLVIGVAAFVAARLGMKA